MKTRSILLMLALGAFIAMAFTFSPSETTENVPVPQSTVIVDEANPLLSIPVGTELYITDNEGNVTEIKVLTQEMKDALIAGFEKPSNILKGKSVPECQYTACIDHHFYCCFSNGVSTQCHAYGLCGGV